MNQIEYAARIVPSARQLAWQELEFYSFIHFGINTFTDREWGTGAEDPALFHPTALDADQWVSACKSAGMKALILTCKHHDGFCLWPSRYTTYSVQSSPWRAGRGDLVREVAQACQRGGLKFGVYLSPWDRHEPCYGTDAYNSFFRDQLRELLTQYGELFCVWFDGACGEGPNGKRQVYDWESYYSLVRELQPQAVISICGPDVRWCGNEAGHCRPSEWSVVPQKLRDRDLIMAKSQQIDDGSFFQHYNPEDDDLGSRARLSGETDLVWYPAEVDTSIRPGWFYHADQDSQVKSLESLLDIYEQSVGGNACLLLNLPPDRRGLVHEADCARLAELGQVIRQTYTVNLAATAQATASHQENLQGCEHLFTADSRTFWQARAGETTAEITVDLGAVQAFDRIVLKENIRLGQRIEQFTLAAQIDGHWQDLYQGTVVGYQRICRLPQTRARYLKLSILQARLNPTLSFFGVCQTPGGKTYDNL